MNIYLSFRTFMVGEQPVGRSANVKRWKWFLCERGRGLNSRSDTYVYDPFNVRCRRVY